MNFHTRKWVKPEDLNPNGTLFGGSLLGKPQPHGKTKVTYVKDRLSQTDEEKGEGIQTGGLK